MPGTAEKKNNPPAAKEVAWVEVDGPTAAKMLECNHRNRPMNEGSAQDMARDILAGDFDDNGETVKFATEDMPDGTTRELLVDGQTRLRAVQIAAEQDPGVKVITLVVRGLRPSVALTIDTGKIRTYNHHLAMQGMSGSRNTAPVIRRVVNWDAGYYVPAGAARVRMTLKEIQRYHEQNSEVLERAILQGQRMNRTHGLSPTVAGAAFVLFERIHRQTAWDFFRDLYNWTEIAVPRHPVVVLVQAFMNRNRSDGLTPDAALALLILGWNAVALRETKGRFILRDEQLTNAKFPQPQRPVWI